MVTTTQKVKLSPEQEAIVEYNKGEGALLVEAAAGSGKTRMLTERARYLLTHKKGRFSILCLTFTNQAAEEMQARLATSDISKRANIGNFHKFALQILIERRFSIGYEKVPHILEREEDKKKILEQVFIENPILKEYYMDKDEKTQRKYIDHYMNWINEQKKNLVIIDDDTPQYNGWKEQSLLLYKSYNQLLREQNLVDFDDVLLLAYRILIENPAITRLYQNTYPYILVDEAQDLSFAQYHLIKALTGDTHKNVFMVGDPNQAIYSFAGANKKFMLEDFIEDFNAERKTIDKNFRSSKAVIEFANSILPSGSNPEDAYYEGEVKIESFDDDDGEAMWVYKKIKALMSRDDETFLRKQDEIDGILTLDKIAVLARNRFVFAKLEQLLKNDDYFKNNYFVKRRTEILDLESDLMKIFDLGTRIISNPSNQLHFQQILNYLKIVTPPQYKGKNGFEKLSELASLLSKEEIKLFQDYHILLQAWQILSNNQSKMYDALNLIKAYTDNLKSDEERDLVLGDIDNEYRNAWTKFLNNTASNNINLSTFRQVLAMGITNAHKQKGLTLATVHTAKGLGFEVVFLMGMAKGTFPDYRATTPSLLDEEKNTAYVAVTRAKRWLYLTYPMKRILPWGSKFQEPSDFILKK